MAAKHLRRASDNGGKASVEDPTAQTLKCHLINPSLLKREAQHIYSVKKMKVTTSPGALVCLHMIHGMPMLVPMAICAAQLMYLVPSSLNAASKCWYSFSIWQADLGRHFVRKEQYNQRTVHQAMPK
jgi:hypothetical protein